MLAFVPVRFDLYRTVRPALRWTLQNLVAFADRTGRCWPSVRKLAEHAGLSKSACGRHLIALEAAGVLTRQRRPGRVCVYQIAPQFLPRAPVSHQREAAVPRKAGQETEPPKQTREARPRARFAKTGISFGELPDDRAKWEARLRSWRKSRFWLPTFGPRPDELGCLAPAALLQSAS